MLHSAVCVRPGTGDGPGVGGAGGGIGGGVGVGGGAGGGVGGGVGGNGARPGMSFSPSSRILMQKIIDSAGG